MPKVRRNDPCPCGSGRKYKNCCMRQERVTASRELHLGLMEAALLNAIYEYAQSPRFLSDTVDAFHFFWGGVFDLGGIGEMDHDDRLRTVEWYIHDHKMKGDGRHIIDRFTEDEAADLPPEVLRTLEAWSRSVMALHRVLAIGPGTTLRLYDPLRKMELSAEDTMLARNAQMGDLIVGRRYVQDGVERLSLMTMILPREYEPGLVAYVSNAYALYHDEHPAADWDAFLRANGHLFQAYMLSARAAALRSLVGPGTRYHDPAISRDRLWEYTRQREREEEAESRAGDRRPSRTSELTSPAFRRTSSGVLLPGAEEPQAPSDEDDEEEEAERAPAPRILIPGRDF